MTQEPLIIRGLDDLVAAVPHVIGAELDDSILVFPTNPGSAPIARLDLPETSSDLAAAIRGLAPVYANRIAPVVLLAYTDRRDLAQTACAALQVALAPGCPVVAAATVNGDRWVRLDRPEHGMVRQADRDRFSGETLHPRAATPYSSLAQHGASFDPAHGRLPAALMDAAHAAASAVMATETGTAQERAWMTVIVNRLVATGAPPSPADAARLLSDIQHVSLRDHAWAGINRQDAPAQAALWKDLLTRAPQGCEAPAASLAAFSYWISGDGLSARAALQRIPPDRGYSMANLIGTALRAGIDPSSMTIPNELSHELQPPIESTSSGAHHERRDPPPQAHTGRTPGIRP